MLQADRTSGKKSKNLDNEVARLSKNQMVVAFRFLDNGLDAFPGLKRHGQTLEEKFYNKEFVESDTKLLKGVFRGLESAQEMLKKSWPEIQRRFQISKTRITFNNRKRGKEDADFDTFREMQKRISEDWGKNMGTLESKINDLRRATSIYSPELMNNIDHENWELRSKIRQDRLKQQSSQPSDQAPG